MAGNRTKLELTWIGKEQRPRLEPRILIEDSGRSYHAPQRVTEHDIFDNRLIHGDNLLALKALEQEFAGKIKCIYIDPPFNTGQALDHYDDGVEHSIWLSLMRDRISSLHSLLTSDGSIFVHIDDNELGYLVVLMDEIFGRDNRAYIVTFKQGSTTGHKSINPGCVSTTNFLLWYAKDKTRWSPNRVYTGRERDKRYNQYIVRRDEHFAHWEFTTLASAFADHKGVSARSAKREIPDYDSEIFEFVMENADRVAQLVNPDYDSVSSAARQMIDNSAKHPKRVFHLARQGYSDMYFLRGKRILFYSDTLKLVDGAYVTGEPLTTLWDDIPSHNLHNEGGVSFPKSKKPEALIKRVLELATNPGDWVLDSFAGSGTTGAVAHKMLRRWIMVELGDHAFTHVIPRMKAVIDGSDSSGVSQATSWNGGGGFRFYELAPSLLEKDKWGNWVVSECYNAEMLAEAMCKLEGFDYAPSDSVYWQHGQSTERDFIYVTTQTLTSEQLRHLSEEVGDERTLLVCCSAFRAKPDAFPNLTIRKIPDAVMKRCEWGRDDYSLRVAELPMAEPVADASLNGRAPEDIQTTMQELPLFAKRSTT